MGIAATPTVKQSHCERCAGLSKRLTCCGGDTSFSFPVSSSEAPLAVTCVLSETLTSSRHPQLHCLSIQNILEGEEERGSEYALRNLRADTFNKLAGW